MTTSLTPVQKSVIRELIKLSIDNGFRDAYPLEPIAAKHGLTVKDLYDLDRGTGLLWDLGPYGEGLLDIGGNGTRAGLYYDTQEILVNWCRE